MKSFYLSILLLCFFKVSSAQNVNIPDANFKNALVNHDPIIDTNGDGEIQVAEAELAQEISINLNSSFISSIQGLEAFANLIELEMSNFNYSGTLVIENLSNLNLIHLYQFSAENLSFNNLVNLNEIIIDNNQNQNFITTDFSTCGCANLEKLSLFYASNITSLNVNNLVNLKSLDLHEMPNLLELDFENLVHLEDFGISYTGISELDFSNQPNLESLGIFLQFMNSINLTNNPNLSSITLDIYGLSELDLSQNPNIENLEFQQANIEYLNLKNGNVPINFYISSSSNFNYICVDEEELSQLQNFLMSNPNTVVNSYCSFTPGGEYYTIEGESRVDANTNGCDVGDNFYPNIKLALTDDTNNGTYLADTSGSYSVPVSEGVHTISPVLENPAYFTVSPTSSTITFPDAGNSYVQDNCLSPNGVHNDVEVVIVPTSQAVPGFDSYYTIIYRNKGNTTLSGSLSFDFEDDFMDFLSATPTENINAIGNLQWNYTNLQPFETREIDVVFNLNTPTDSNFPLNSGDVLSFNASIDPVNSDETPDDNMFVLEQIVVNSYDPNDIRCLEGEAIPPEKVGGYVHYLIRFENLGTANAVNVVVKDVIDETKFDVSTLIPINASHDFVTRIREDNVVEFIFENIQLPFDDANNDGYVLFKIKTLDSLVLEDTFENQAEIYFDFNFPIITNNYSTEVVEDNLGLGEYVIDEIELFPNPAEDRLYIKSQEIIDSIRIFDVNGRLVHENYSDNFTNEKDIPITLLVSGIYFVEIKINEQKSILRFIKE